MLLTIGENFLVVTVTQRPGNITERYQLFHLAKGPYTRALHYEGPFLIIRSVCTVFSDQ